MKTIHELKTGDEIQAYMRLSLSLELGRTKDGGRYRYVPIKPQRASNLALSRFRGTVITNDTLNAVIRVNTVGINSRGAVISSSESAPAEISYTAFNRVFLLSPYHFDPRSELRRGGNDFRPTTSAFGTSFKAYRTLELIHIPNENNT